MGIQIENNEILDFVEYVDSFYNPATGVYPIKGATVKAITEAVKTYIGEASTWGDGDSVDREFVRDIIIKNGGVVIE
jgi:hypothetical protein